MGKGFKASCPFKRLDLLRNYLYTKNSFHDYKKKYYTASRKIFQRDYELKNKNDGNNPSYYKISFLKNLGLFKNKKIDYN